MRKPQTRDFADGENDFAPNYDDISRGGEARIGPDDGEDPGSTDRPAGHLSRAGGDTLVAWLIRQFVPDTAFGWASMLVQALAWPASAVIIAAIFRAEVRLVLERVVRLKYRDFEAQFHLALRQTEELAERGAPKRLLDLPDGERRVIREVDRTPPRPGAAGPRALVESAWSELSAAADRAAETVGVDPAPALAARGAMSGLDLILFDRLRWLHAEVARAVDWCPPQDAAARFAGLARSLASRLVRAEPHRARPADRA